MKSRHIHIYIYIWSEEAHAESGELTKWPVSALSPNFRPGKKSADTHPSTLPPPCAPVASLRLQVGIHRPAEQGVGLRRLLQRLPHEVGGLEARRIERRPAKLGRGKGRKKKQHGIRANKHTRRSVFCASQKKGTPQTRVRCPLAFPLGQAPKRTLHQQKKDPAAQKRMATPRAWNQGGGPKSGLTKKPHLLRPCNFAHGKIRATARPPNNNRTQCPRHPKTIPCNAQVPHPGNRKPLSCNRWKYKRRSAEIREHGEKRQRLLKQDFVQQSTGDLPKSPIPKPPIHRLAIEGRGPVAVVAPLEAAKPRGPAPRGLKLPHLARTSGPPTGRNKNDGCEKTRNTKSKHEKDRAEENSTKSAKQMNRSPPPKKNKNKENNNSTK